MIRRCRIDDATAIQEINKYQLGYDYPVTKTVDNLKRLLEDKNHHFIFVFENENTKKLKGIFMQNFLKKPILTLC